MRNAVFGPRTYEKTSGVERLGGIFSRFSAEGVGGGVAERRGIAFDEARLKKMLFIVTDKILLSIICIIEVSFKKISMPRQFTDEEQAQITQGALKAVESMGIEVPVKNHGDNDQQQQQQQEQQEQQHEQEQQEQQHEQEQQEQQEQQHEQEQQATTEGGRRRTKRKQHKKGKSAKKSGKKHRKSSGKKSRRSSSKKSRRNGRK